MKYLMDLNPQQKSAVTHKEGPLLIVAGPGSGKTHVIIERVKNLVQSQIPQSAILCLTFTEKAADEMKQRLEKEISGFFSQIEIQKKTIDNAFTIDPTLDAIDEIISLEVQKDATLNPDEIIINITGGTNAIAAASILAATFYGTRANYIREPQPKDPRGTRYVEEIPIQPIGIAKTNTAQKEILEIISNSVYEINSDKVLDNEEIDQKHMKKIRDVIEKSDKKRTDGAIRSTELVEKWMKSEKNKGRTNRKERNFSVASARTKVKALVDKLIKARYVEKIEGTEEWEIINLKDQYERTGTFKAKNPKFKPEIGIKVKENEIYYKITVAGRRKAKDRLIFDRLA